ncbi:MAG TPA: hypothetical protein VHM24_09960 [Gemmatimonadaceae bacterium]|nr:hypothetical protein [Gemmatimonadaceae bacterium]
MKIYLLATALLVIGCKRAEPVLVTADSGGETTNASRNLSRSTPESADTGKLLTCGVTEPPELNDTGVGDLVVGRPVSEVKERCQLLSDTFQRGTEGGQERIIAVLVAGEILSSTVVDGRISRIGVTTPRIRTTDSLGVDTPLQKIAAMRGAQFFPGEDGVYAFVAAHCALSFRFSLPLRPPKGGQWTPAAIATAHGDAAVDRVLVGECRK